MTLKKLYIEFEKKCNKFTLRANEILINKHTCTQWEFNYLTETLVSDLWQAWCLFCRKVVINSCQGTKTRSNIILPALSLPDISTVRLLYKVSRNRKGFSISTNGHLNFQGHHDITWGDSNSLIQAITYLNPVNKNNLISAFGSSNISKHIQDTRNFCAHKNKGTLDNCLTFNSDYDFSRIKSPIEIIWSTHNDTNEYAIIAWIYYCQLMADFATG